MTLREEVEKYFKDLDKIFHEANVAQIGHCVLTFIDQHEDNRKGFGNTTCTRCRRDVPAYCFKCWEGYDKRDERSKPSEERPARDALVHGAANVVRQARAAEKARGVDVIALLCALACPAIVEAIDAHAAAIRQARK